MPVPAGQKPHVVTLQRKVETPDAMNAPQRAWHDEKEMFAAVRPLGVMERSEAAKLVGQATHLVTVGGLEGEFTPEKRFLFTDYNGVQHTLEIVGAMDWDCMAVDVRIQCRERL